MDCNELVELITDYLEGALSAEHRARFDAHLAECDDCALYLEQMQRTVDAVGALEVEALSPAAQQRLLEAFRDFRPG